MDNKGVVVANECVKELKQVLSAGFERILDVDPTKKDLDIFVTTLSDFLDKPTDDKVDDFLNGETLEKLKVIYNGETNGK